MPTQNGTIFNKLRTNGANTIRNFRSNMVNKGSATIFVILALICIAVLIAFLVMKLKSVNTNGVLIIGDPLKLYNMTSQVRVDQSVIPPTVNGQEYSFSFWLYLVDFIPTMDGPQLVFMRGTDGSTVGTSNPIVAFDGTTNKLYVSVRTNTSAIATPAQFFKPNSSAYLTSTVEYFPLQRWVNIVAVVKDDSLSLYMNSSLYTVNSVSEIQTSGAVNTRPVIQGCTGSMFIGASGVAGVRDPRAYICQFKFFNYALTLKDIASIYTNGPNSTSFFAKLGLAGYGLRSPVYRIES